MGLAFLILGRFDEAVAAAKKAIHKNPQLPTPYRCLAAALAHLGREEEVRDAVARLLDRRPNFRISAWAAGHRPGRPHQLYVDGLIKAGLPE
jgi:adenylate cyclase